MTEVTARKGSEPKEGGDNHYSYFFGLSPSILKGIAGGRQAHKVLGQAFSSKPTTSRKRRSKRPSVANLPETGVATLKAETGNHTGPVLQEASIKPPERVGGWNEKQTGSSLKRACSHLHKEVQQAT